VVLFVFQEMTVKRLPKLKHQNESRQLSIMPVLVMRSEVVYKANELTIELMLYALQLRLD
jgi:hypothetical protein